MNKKFIVISLATILCSTNIHAMAWSLTSVATSLATECNSNGNCKVAENTLEEINDYKLTGVMSVSLAQHVKVMQTENELLSVEDAINEILFVSMNLIENK